MVLAAVTVAFNNLPDFRGIQFSGCIPSFLCIVLPLASVSIPEAVILPAASGTVTTVTRQGYHDKISLYKTNGLLMSNARHGKTAGPNGTFGHAYRCAIRIVSFTY
jgi:hypothetical protein